MKRNGITEARRAKSQFFGPEGVIDNLSRAVGASPDEIGCGILEAARAHAGGSLQDDAAIVVFELEAENKE